MARRHWRRIRQAARDGIVAFAIQYRHVANSQGVHKPRRLRWTVPGLWLDRVLAAMVLVVIAVQFV